MRLAKCFAAKLRSFRIAENGAAAVEFALILPAMLILYVGANEASMLISMDRKVQLISGAVGDLVARTDTDISSGDLQNYVNVAGGIISPYVVDGMVQIVSQVKVENGKAKVVWSRGFDDQEPDPKLDRADGAEYVLPQAVLDIAEGDHVIVAETRLPYTPLYGIVYTSPVTLYRENFFMPRFGGRIRLDGR
ncbi:TadE/TadG family type IV pilus assembly protein [Devosia submarina]|uniref:TadE/TadG family type IV pilus assembly protein n=1 Tax=Devosia submarina TaxID=1173082 RepID=UPI000D39A795|nr:TadE/TadG family type IV pilus assembly protein [Devosia submarina]